MSRVGTFKLDDAPLNKFHLRISALAFGANFSDGYAIGIIAVALSIIDTDMNISPLWNGLLGSAALLGLFFGSLILGRLSDHIGRQKIFITNFFIIAVASLLQFWVTDPITLFILRLAIGFGLGGDYAVGQALLVEFIPKKYRGFLLSSTVVMWTVGYVASNVLSYYMNQLGPHAWRWMLVSAALPAFLVLFMRIGVPESPRWLMSKGQKEKAQHIVAKHISPNAIIDETSQTKEIYSYLSLFNKNLWKRTVFGSLFYFCMVVPYYAIYTFLPSILDSLRLEYSFAVDLLLNLFLLIGGVVGIWMVEKSSRRKLAINTFIVMGVTLLPLGLLGSSYQMIQIVCFVLFTFLISAVSNLTAVYPAELFPTEIRSTGIGFATAVSRIGAAIGTFFLPITLTAFGLQATMLGLVGVIVFGAIISIAWAPETKDLPLDQVSDPNLNTNQFNAAAVTLHKLDIDHKTILPPSSREH